MTPETAESVRVLLVDDDRDDYLLTKELFAEMTAGAYHLDWVHEYAEALASIRDCGHDVLIFDYRLGAKTGIELIADARAMECHAPVILLTGQGKFEIDRAAAAAGAADYLEKDGLTAVVLERAIRYALLQKRCEVELEKQVRERTDELARANDSLKESARRKDEFLATLAHELRNPLAPIRNALSIMAMASDVPPPIARARSIMDRQVRQMVRLIDDLLDISRITYDKLSLQQERLALGDVLATAVEATAPTFAAAGVTLHVSDSPKPVWIMGDSVRLVQVFTNLLNNAPKYTPPQGTVWLTVRSTDMDVTVRVKDTGLGIPAELMPDVFNIFTQIDRTLNRSQGGLGIGLALVRRFVEMHGGTVDAASDGIGRGAEFTVRLPRVE